MEASMSLKNVTEVLGDAVASAATHLPTVAGAILLVAVGWVAAKLVALAARALGERTLNRLPADKTFTSALDASGARAVAPKLIASFVFWIVLILFVVGAVEILGLPILTDLFGRLATYAPNIIAAVALVVGGLVIARLGRGVVAQAATLMRLEHQAEALAGIAHAVVVAIAVVMALEQLGIQGRVLEIVLAVTLGSVLAAVGLAFALGARSAVANIVAARYVAQLCQVGQEIEIDQIRGTVVQLTSTAVVVETVDGQVVVPAARFHEGCPTLLKAS
jgi:hypothetical protein